MGPIILTAYKLNFAFRVVLACTRVGETFDPWNRCIENRNSTTLFIKALWNIISVYSVYMNSRASNAQVKNAADTEMIR